MNRAFAKLKTAPFLTFFLLLLACFKPLLAADSLTKYTQENPPLFDMNDLKIGMQGEGITVFSTIKGLEVFKFEVLGVLYGFSGPGQDLVLVKMLGKHFQKSQVAAGMSGSPMFVNGKLLGALSYSIGDFYTEGALAGVTPVKDMLASASFQTKTTKLARTDLNKFKGLKPVKMPLVYSGFSLKTLSKFEGDLARRGFGLAEAGTTSSGSAAKEQIKNIYPGSPVAAVLVDGPVRLAAIGTTTWLKDDKFLAFGHPFMQTGESQIPAATAFIITTIFSQRYAYKVGQLSQNVGVLTDDRKPAVAGVLGKTPKMIPFRLTVNNKVENYRLANMTKDLPLFAGMVLANSLDDRIQKELGGFYELKAAARLSSGETVYLKRQFSSPKNPLENEVSKAFQQWLTAFYVQEFKSVQVTSIQVEIVHEKKARELELRHLSLGKKINAGKENSLFLTVKPWNSNLEVENTSVFAFKGLAEGKYTFLALDRKSAIEFEFGQGIRTKPKNFAEFINSVDKLPEDVDICTYLKPLETKSSKLSLLTGKQAYLIKCFETGQVVSGKIEVEVEVVHEEKR